MPSATSSDRKLFAVVPAAGHSRRMGEPKLLLPLEGQTVIARLLLALDHPQIAGVFVVVRRTDTALVTAVQTAGGRVVHGTTDPPDMLASVKIALAEVSSQQQPDNNDGWLLVPGDHPVLDRECIARLIDAWQESSADILIPTHNGRRGHPAFFRWSVTSQIPQIPPDHGLNWLTRHPGLTVHELPVTTRAILTDLDTPEDYAKLLKP